MFSDWHTPGDFNSNTSMESMEEPPAVSSLWMNRSEIRDGLSSSTRYMMI